MPLQLTSDKRVDTFLTSLAEEVAVSCLIDMPISLARRVTVCAVKATRVPTNNRASGAPTALLVALLSAGLTVALVACHGDRQESFYPTLAEADKDGAITRGWIPYFLPGSSRDIHEIHDLSPSTEWCAFEFLPSDSQVLRERLERVQTLSRTVRAVPSPGVPWWPDALSGNLDVKKIGSAGFHLYVVVEPATSVTTATFLFAIDWTKGRGFFYDASGG